MKMKDLKIEIDLKDLYSEGGEYGEGEDVNTLIKEEIQTQVVRTIVRGFTPEVVKQLKDQTVEKFSDEFGAKISTRISKAIDRGVFVDKDGKTFNIDTLVKEKFEISLTGRNNFLEKIDEAVKNQIAEMQEALQDRYDLQFASGIIKNLKDNNLLKEGAEKLLLKEE